MRAVTQSTLNRASDAIQSRWFDTNGEAFDWYAIGGNSYTMGTLPTLFLDKHGKRYMNEDVQGQQHAERIWGLKDCIAMAMTFGYIAGKNAAAGV